MDFEHFFKDMTFGSERIKCCKLLFMQVPSCTLRWTYSGMTCCSSSHVLLLFAPFWAIAVPKYCQLSNNACFCEVVKNCTHNVFVVAEKWQHCSVSRRCISEVSVSVKTRHFYCKFVLWSRHSRLDRYAVSSVGL